MFSNSGSNDPVTAPLEGQINILSIISSDIVVFATSMDPWADEATGGGLFTQAREIAIRRSMRQTEHRISSPLLDHLTPRAPDRATEFKLSQCSKGTPTKSPGEATPSSGPVALLVSWPLTCAYHVHILPLWAMNGTRPRPT